LQIKEINQFKENKRPFSFFGQGMSTEFNHVDFVELKGVARIIFQITGYYAEFGLIKKINSL